MALFAIAKVEQKPSPLADDSARVMTTLPAPIKRLDLLFGRRLRKQRG
jgi:hypothetical protein